LLEYYCACVYKKQSFRKKIVVPQQKLKVYCDVTAPVTRTNRKNPICHFWVIDYPSAKRLTEAKSLNGPKSG
jgi:hypothetical protein